MSEFLNASFASTVVVFRLGLERTSFEVLAFLYTKKKKGQAPFTSWKFPTETGEPSETPWKAASNGMYRELSEMADNPIGFDFMSPDTRDGLNEPIPFLVSKVPSDPGTGVCFHLKCVFLVLLDPASEVHLRKVEKLDGTDEVLGVPEFVEAGELWKRMLERGQPFHRAVLLKTIERFAIGNPKICDRYRNILEAPSSKEAIKTKGYPVRFEREEW